MIELLAESESMHPLVVREKLNELIDAFNQHYHKSLDTQYFTTEPWTEPVKVKGVENGS